MRLQVEHQQEEDGRWIAEIPESPGVMCYIVSHNETVAEVESLALRAIVDRPDEGRIATSPIIHRDVGTCSRMSKQPTLKTRLALTAPFKIG